MGSFSIWHWLIVLVITMMMFGTEKLRNIGPSLDGAVKGFKGDMHGGQKDKPAGSQQPQQAADQSPHELHNSTTVGVKARDKSKQG